MAKRNEIMQMRLVSEIAPEACLVFRIQDLLRQRFGDADLAERETGMRSTTGTPMVFGHRPPEVT